MLLQQQWMSNDKEIYWGCNKKHAIISFYYHMMG